MGKYMTIKWRENVQEMPSRAFVSILDLVVKLEGCRNILGQLTRPARPSIPDLFGCLVEGKGSKLHKEVNISSPTAAIKYQKFQ